MGCTCENAYADMVKTRMDIRDAIGVSFSWSQFVKEMEKRGYTWKLNRKYPALKTPDMERYVRLRSLGKGYGEAEIREKILRPKIQQVYGKTQVQFSRSRNGFLMRSVPISENWISASGRWSFCKKRINTRKSWQHTGNLWRNRCFP